MPIVSVVLPVYNGEKFLREAIESILCQTFGDFEFIIIDDGSRDGTISIIQSHHDKRIRLFQNATNLGIIHTLNNGLAEAQGKYICRMDADDIAEPERLREQVHFLEANPRIAMAGSNVRTIDESGTVMGIEQYPQTNEEIRKAMFVHNPFAHSTVMIRRDVLDVMGQYDHRFLHNEDYDLWLRIASRYEVANMAQPLLKRRLHGESITGAKNTQLTGYRIRTLVHAIMNYFRNPLLLVYIVRPTVAYAYRSLKGVVAG